MAWLRALARAVAGRLAQLRPERDPRQGSLRRRRVGLHRLASGGLAAAAVACALQVLAPDPPDGVPAVAMSRDAPAGTLLGAHDVQAVQLPEGARPDGAVPAGSATGRVLASGARAGEVLTDVRLVGPGLLAGQSAGQVAAPVRVADPAAAALVAPGDRVDVLVAVEGRAGADVVVHAATVLSGTPVPEGDAGLLSAGAGGDPGAGGLLVLAVAATDAASLAGAASKGPLSITLLPPETLLPAETR